MAPSATPEAATVEDILNPGEPAELILDDGSRFEGWSFGAATSAAGEAVFQTGAPLMLWRRRSVAMEGLTFRTG